MAQEFKLLINGELRDGTSRFAVINPASEEVVAMCPKADETLLDEAVAAADAAFPAWSARSHEDRVAVLSKLGDAIEKRSDELARLLTSEQGKPLDQAQFEVMGTIGTLRAFLGMRIEDQTIRDEDGNRVVEHRTPLGVCAAITPWNFPLILLFNKAAPALLTGNTMIAKPAPTTPLTTCLIGEIAADILPPGVLNIICDENELGPKITTHPKIAKISFTGSTETGAKVLASSAADIKRVTLELGGNDAAIVLDDVPPKLAAERIYQGAMANAGQICVAIKRAYVPRSMYDEFCAEIAKLANAAVVDDGAKQGSTIGPIQNRMQYEKVKGLIEDSRSRGDIIAGGDIPDRKGYFIPPTIVRDLNDEAPLVTEEQFGPVLPVLAYDSIEDVLSRANNSPYGLGGTVWGMDLEVATAVAMQIDSGTVWVNQHLAIDPTIPFRGSKKSGMGGELGMSGLMEYTQAHIVNSVPLSQ